MRAVTQGSMLGSLALSRLYRREYARRARLPEPASLRTTFRRI
jgi:hypothetical protein